MKESNTKNTDFNDNSDLLSSLHKHFMIMKSFSETVYDDAKENGNERLKDTYPVLNGVASNIHSIALLTSENKCNDAYIITRALIERIITFLYLQFCDNDEYNSYIAYSRQKIYRKLDQNIQVNDKAYRIKSSAEVDLELNKDLKDSIEQFTGKKSGGEITRWSKVSLFKKLEAIEKNKILSEKHFSLLMIAFNSIYDDASEAMHSTMYGCTFHYGGIFPGSENNTEEEQETEANNIMRHLMTLTTLLVNMTIVYLGNIINAPDVDKKMHELAMQLLTISKQS